MKYFVLVVLYFLSINTLLSQVDTTNTQSSTEQSAESNQKKENKNLNQKTFGKRVEIIPFVGIHFGGRINLNVGEFNLDNDVGYGLAVDFRLKSKAVLEFSWNQSILNYQFRAYNNSGFVDEEGKVMVNYFLLGSNKEWDLNRFKLFFGGALGASNFSPQSDVVKDSWQFAFSFNGGFKVYFNKRIGLRIQGRLLLPLFLDSAGLFCGIGTGGASCGVGTSGDITILQGDITAGLIIGI